MAGVDYTPIRGDDFSVVVTMPATSLGPVPGDYLVRSIVPKPNYPLTAVASLAGKVKIPLLPKVDLAVGMLFLDSAPTAPFVLPGIALSASHEIVFDQWIITALLLGYAFSTTEIGKEGGMGIDVNAGFQYVGVRDGECDNTGSSS